LTSLLERDFDEMQIYEEQEKKENNQEDNVAKEKQMLSQSDSSELSSGFNL
jgi:hypothetical protein